MYHSMAFNIDGTIVNTYDDWKIVANPRPHIAPPKQKRKTIEVPGRDGVLDLSTSLTGYPVFQNRTGTIEFTVLNRFFNPVLTYSEWYETYSKVMDFLNGKSGRCILEDDPSYEYTGVFSVESWKTEKSYSKITIGYDLNPYKRLIQSTLGDTEWNPFGYDFSKHPQTGVFSASGNGNVVISLSPLDIGSAPTKPVIDILSSSDSVTVTLNNGIKTISKDVKLSLTHIGQMAIYKSSVVLSDMVLVGKPTRISVESKSDNRIVFTLIFKKGGF